jgi:predicted alpha-1,2-mannosidase
MARPGPDVFYPQPTSGYASGKPILRVSHTHVAGTGGASRYANIGLTPFTGPVRRNAIAPMLAVPFRRAYDSIPTDETGEVGYYAFTMQPFGVRTELTCTDHVGLTRLTYPSADGENRLLLDAGAVLESGWSTPGHLRAVETWDSSGASIGGYLQIVSPTEFAGRADLRGGWGHDQPYSIFYYVRLDVPWQEVELANRHGLAPSHEGASVVGPECRAAIRLAEGQTVNVQAGVSFVSVAQARQYVETEAAGRGFEIVRDETRDIWDAELSRFRIEGGSDDHRRLFYSCLYRLLCMPTNLGVDQEHPLWKSGIRQFTDYYCLWDSVRNANSFFALFRPELHADMLNSLLDIAEHTGWLPDAHIACHHAYMQSACAADVIFAESAAKGIEGVDYRKALHYCKKNSDVAPPDPTLKGRYIEQYHKLGYLPADIPNASVSRHIEYTYYDWCISQLAEHLGETSTAERFGEQAGRVWNLWRQEVCSFAPRYADGSWMEDYDVWSLVGDHWNDPACYEATAAVWSMNVLHDLPGLIERLGGEDGFVEHLDRLFERGFSVKETKMHMPHLYTCAGRDDLAAERVREALTKIRNERDGIPGNEDMGCTAAFFLFNSMGLYPVIGQTHYLLCPPVFDRIEADLGETGKRLTITAERSGEGRYIQGVSLNGQPLDRAWVEHNELPGATLHFTLGDQPEHFATRRPPMASISSAS